jgi:hypothetical protein
MGLNSIVKWQLPLFPLQILFPDKQVKLASNLHSKLEITGKTTWSMHKKCRTCLALTWKPQIQLFQRASTFLQSIHATFQQLQLTAMAWNFKRCMYHVYDLWSNRQSVTKGHLSPLEPLGIARTFHKKKCAS